MWVTPFWMSALHLLIANTEKRYHAGAAPTLGITQKLVVFQHWKAVLRRCLASAAPVVCQRLAQCWSAALALLTDYNRNGTAPVVRIGSTPIFPPGGGGGGGLYLQPKKCSFFLIFFKQQSHATALWSFAYIYTYVWTTIFDFLRMKFFQNGGCSSHLPKVLRKIDFCGNHPTAQSNHLKLIKFWLL